MTVSSNIFLILILNTFFCSCSDHTYNLSANDSDPATAAMNKSTYYIDGLKCRKISPKPNNRIVKVVDDKALIWSGEGSECTGVIVYPEQGQGKLVHLFLTTSSQNGHEYFVRDGDTWKKIDLFTYRKRLDEFVSVSPRDPTKPTDKKKLGSALAPNVLLVVSLPLIIAGYNL